MMGQCACPIWLLAYEVHIVGQGLGPEIGVRDVVPIDALRRTLAVPVGVDNIHAAAVGGINNHGVRRGRPRIRLPSHLDDVTGIQIGHAVRIGPDIRARVPTPIVLVGRNHDRATRGPRHYFPNPFLAFLANVLAIAIRLSRGKNSLTLFGQAHRPPGLADLGLGLSRCEKSEANDSREEPREKHWALHNAPFLRPDASNLKRTF
jgi:hypothetical protein